MRRCLVTPPQATSLPEGGIRCTLSLLVECRYYGRNYEELYSMRSTRPCHSERSVAESNFSVRDPERYFAPFDPPSSDFGYVQDDTDGKAPSKAKVESRAGYHCYVFPRDPTLRSPFGFRLRSRCHAGVNTGRWIVIGKCIKHICGFNFVFHTVELQFRKPLTLGEVAAKPTERAGLVIRYWNVYLKNAFQTRQGSFRNCQRQCSRRLPGI